MNKQDDEYICVDREHGLWKRKEPKENVNADRLALALALETIRELERENAALRELITVLGEYASSLAHEWSWKRKSTPPNDREMAKLDAAIDAARKEAQP